MKRLIVTFGVFCAFGLINEVSAQTGATSAKNTTDKDGKQCSSVGYGSNKEQAEKNRDKAEKGAREKGNESFSGKEGGGAAGCKDKPTREARDPK